MKKTLILSILSAALLIVACHKPSLDGLLDHNESPSLPSTAYDYQWRVQQTNHFNMPVDPINNEIATLGRVLFYERKLSANNAVSCGSCHIQSLAFTDGMKSSEGLALKNTPRNTPTICNAVNQSHYFWDGREDSLVNMVMKPISNHIEMGISDPEVVVKKIQSLDYYKPLFLKAFGDETVNKERIAQALKQFISSIVSFESKQDQEKVKSPEQIYTLDERVGRELFLVSLPCASCHGADHAAFGWGGSRFENIGLEEHYSDKGLGNTNTSLEGMFKVPSLRNIALTAPYMHDGRFRSLDEVITFYSQNIQPHANLSSNLRAANWGSINFFPFGATSDPNIAQLAKVTTNSSSGKFSEPLRFTLSNYQKQCLIAYLKTFTDTRMISDPMYADPFKK